MFDVAPAMLVHEVVAVDVHRRHWYANAMGAAPDQDPVLPVSVLPTRTWPEMTGKAVFVGGDDTGE